MPTQTKFICPSGGVNVDFSGVFEELNGGTAYGSATNFKVGALDLTGYFHASTSAEDRPSFNTGYKIGANDLSTIFRRRGYVNDPVITSQPTAITKTTTQSATFTVQFTCVSVPVTYQWKKDGTNLTGTGSSGTVSSAGANTLSYIINSVAMGNQGNYSITLTGAGVVNSSNARLSISPRIISTGDPAGPYTLYYGSTNSQVLNLQITNADGETPLSYQWYKNSSTLGSGSGAQTSQYTKTIANGDSGTYTCIVTNAYGTATTGNFVITALSGVPTISSHPSNQIVNNNTTATFSVSASANGAALSYQWKKDNVDIEGATSNAYSISNTTTSNDGSYTCFISTIYGSITSNAAISRIKPYITTHPVGGSFNQTDGISLSVIAGGSATLFYQWRRNGTDINGATSSSYPSSGQFSLISSTAGTYTCKVTSTHDSTGVISNGATLTIIAPEVSIGITGFSSPYEFNEGQVITITSALAAGTNVNYQWYGPSGLIANGVNGYNIITSGTQLQFTFSASNDGSYYVVATNDGGSDTSTSINIIIRAPIAAISVTGNQTIYNKTDGPVFSSSITNGAINVSYQWKRNGTNVGTNSSTYATPPIDISNVGTYTLTVTNNGGSTTTSGITIYVNPYITTNPSNDTVIAGGNAVFTVAASGSGTLTYQWYRNGSPIGASDPSFADIGVTSAYNGYTYYCVVSSNLPGTTQATSTTATLTVEYAPTLGGVKVNSTTVTSNLQAFGISNGNSFNLEAVSVDDGQPNATTKGWYKYDGTSSPDGNGYNTLVSSDNTVTTFQGNNSTEYYRFRMINTRGTAESYEIQIITS